MTFSAAAKHLFRHLHDARALRKNPIVCSLFETAAGGVKRVYSERGALDRLARLVERAVKHCYDAEVAAGRPERAQRLRTMVIMECVERRSVREIAAKLGLSWGFCYRERAYVCRRIALYIQENADAPEALCLPELDEFRSLVAQAERRALLGDEREALRECDGLLGAASSPIEKVEALRLSALTALHFGNLERAQHAYEHAREVQMTRYDEGGAPRSELAEAYVLLIASRLAFRQADIDEGIRLAERALRKLKAAGTNLPAHVAALIAETQYDLGITFCDLGDLDRGYDWVNAAQAEIRKLTAVPFALDDRVTVSLWRLRSNLLASVKAWYPSSERQSGLIAAYNHAHGTGAVLEATGALLALAEIHAFSGRDAQALRAVRFALFLIKRVTSKMRRAHLTVSAATVLLWTKHWYFVPALLRRDDLTYACTRRYRELLSYVEAQRAYRLGRFEDACSLADCSVRLPALSIGRRLIAAAASAKLNSRRRARTLVEGALADAERLGDASLLEQAYLIAAGVTGDARCRRRSAELRSLLTA